MPRGVALEGMRSGSPPRMSMRTSPPPNVSSASPSFVKRRSEKSVSVRSAPARLAALVPAPYLALRRFHGVFAPHHHLRALIVPTPTADSPVPVARKRPGSMNWADLLMRVWAVDALKCPFCAGRMRVIAAIHDPDAITAILAAVHSDRWLIPAPGPPLDSPQNTRVAA